jgi:hypothetical protein
VSDATRALATATLTAAVGNTGLVVARVAAPSAGAIATATSVAVAVALAAFVATTVASGAHFLAIQRDLRKGWRERLYRFLAEDEYGTMVTEPIGRAERAFRNAAIGSAIVAALMLAAVLGATLR